MKKTVSLLLAICLLLCLGVAASADGRTPRKSAVTELYSAEGEYTDSLGNRESYSYHLPLLTADTPAAEEINREIEERFGDTVEKQFKSMADGYSLWSWNAQWHAYWYGSQLFLLISLDYDGGFTDMAVYGYDFDQKCRVTNQMILEELGISEEDYLSNLRQKVHLMFEEQYRSLSSAQWEMYGMDGLLDNTMSWLDLEQPMLIDGTGQIETIVKIASIAGADWYYHIATPYSWG